VQLAHFIDGDRAGSELHGPAMREALQPPDVKRAQALCDLGAWLSHAPLNRAPEQGSGQALAAGKRAYVSSGHLAHAPGLLPTLVGSADEQQALADYASRLAPTGSSSEE
jgi:hypothetical protein